MRVCPIYFHLLRLISVSWQGCLLALKAFCALPFVSASVPLSLLVYSVLPKKESTSSREFAVKFCGNRVSCQNGGVVDLCEFVENDTYQF